MNSNQANLSDVEHDQSQIRSLSQAWIEAMRAKDIDRLLSMIIDDAVFLPPGSPPVRGHDEVKKMLGTFFSRCHPEQSIAIGEIQICGDWAFTWGAETMKATPVNGGSPLTMRGHGLSILRRQKDGSWKFAWGINNLTLMAPASEAPITPGSSR
jgi:uncharacterized protein (TIGR02246 family)